MPNYYLTDQLVDSLICPDGKSQEIYWDHPRTLDGRIKRGSQKGLGIRVTINGSKAYVHAFRFNGKRCRVVLGAPPKINVNSARLMVQQREIDIEDGRNPDIDVTDYRKAHSITVREAIDMYYTQHVQATGYAHKCEFKRFIAPWVEERPQRHGGKSSEIRFTPFGIIHDKVALDKILPRHIGEFINCFKSSHVSNSALRQLNAMINWAIRMQIVDMRNPCLAFKKRKIIKKRREYTPKQIKAIADHIFNPPQFKIDKTSNGKGSDRRNATLTNERLTRQNDNIQELCNYMGILFLTMARPNEVRQARFDHFNLDTMVWNKHNTKGIQQSKADYEYSYRTVPIHMRVADIIMAQKKRWPESEFVFPSHSGSKEYRDNFSRGLKYFKTLDNVPEYFQLYDLKRIAISLMLNGQGVEREAVSHYVDHKGNLETTMIYDLGFVDPMRPVTDKLGELLGV